MTSEPDATRRFHRATRTWFGSTFAAPTPVQSQGWARIAQGDHCLLIAPTGSGKTLAAFLWAIDRIMCAPLPPDRPPGVRVVYVSPLKALAYDVERNLTRPAEGILGVASRPGGDPTEVRSPRIAMRTGDTPQRDRQRMLRHPPDILVTTPESLYLMLTSSASRILRTVETIIVDEVHALTPSKRGAHLALSLERLAAGCTVDPQRIGLSATARPADEVARFLGGDRTVTIVDTHAPPDIDLQIVVPVPDMTRPQAGIEPAAAARAGGAPAGPGEPRENSVWVAIYPRLLELIAAHRTTIVFVNSRGLCERLAQRLNEESGEEDLVRAHHGSVSHERRKDTEALLKSGGIRAIVATSSLELGIDMEAVDLVVLVESPGSAARGLQRIGRSGHGVGQRSRGRLFPKHRGDLLEAAVVGRAMCRGELDDLSFPRGPLDVLAQHIVSMCAVERHTVADVERVVRRAAHYRDLPATAFVSVLELLSGAYPSHAFADLRPRIVWDRATGMLEARRGAKQIAIWNGGTIPDRGTYAVHLGADGPRIGELDEEMVHESAPGHTIMLGASTWRIEQITRDRVVVQPAPGQPGRLPFWHGDGPGRPFAVGQAMGRLVRELDAAPRASAMARLHAEYRLDTWASENLLDHLAQQRNHTGTLPTDRAVTIERFLDEVGDWRVCVLSPWGARVNAPWGLAIQSALEEISGFEIQAMASDDGIVLRMTDVDALPSLDVFTPDPDEVEDRVVARLADSPRFAAQFRENAARALLLPRARANGRTPLWQQRLKAQQLLAVARDYPSFPILIETYRSCLRDVFDLPALVEILRGIRSRGIRVDHVETTRASPFARSLAFAYTAEYLYDGDAPLAERRAQALQLDRGLLAELLGETDLRDLLDAAVIDEVEDALQCLAQRCRARHPDALHDLLRRLGDLTEGELARRSDPESHSATWLAELVTTGRAVAIDLAGETRYIAVEDARLYHDAMGCEVPTEPLAWAPADPEPLAALLQRYARSHVPFASDAPRARWALPAEVVDDALAGLRERGRLVDGSFRSGRSQRQWCDPEVLRRLKRRMLERLRAEIAPVDPAVMGRFLLRWHGIGDDARTTSLESTIERLEGVPFPFVELEGALLPARVSGFRPADLDRLGASGWLVWIGYRPPGSREGRVALYRRDRVAALLDPPEIPSDLPDLQRRLLDRLEQRGACFLSDLHAACPPEVTIRELHEALWDLVWRGMVTNDTLAVLRSAPGSRPSRRAPTLSGGRWSSVADLVGSAPDATARVHARARSLLERHGIVGRSTFDLESVPGGFAGIYPVLRAMEERGQVRRGLFLAAASGAQFSLPGAVDQLRQQRDEPPQHRARVLSAIDPANPYGWLLPWPASDDDARAPRRISGARVVLVDGAAALYLDASGKALRSFGTLGDPAIRRAALAVLPTVLSGRGRGTIVLETIDELPARTSPLAEALREVGFTSAPRGLLLETSLS